MTAGNGGKLNPDWVELLMGWRKGWTRLDEKGKDWFEKLRKLRRSSGKKDDLESSGGLEQFPKETPLQPEMREQQTDSSSQQLSVEVEKISEIVLRSMRADGKTPRSPSGSESKEQRPGEPSNPLHILPQVRPCDDGAARVEEHPTTSTPWDGDWESGTPRVTNESSYRVDRLRCTGNGVVSIQSTPAWQRIKEIAGE